MGYIFNNWTGDVASPPNSNDPVSVTINQPRTIAANYATAAIVWTSSNTFSAQYSDPTNLQAQVTVTPYGGVSSPLGSVTIAFSVGTDRGNATTDGTGTATDSTKLS